MISNFTDKLSVKTGEKNEETADAVEEIKVEDTSTEGNVPEDSPEEKLPEAIGDEEDNQGEDGGDTEKSMPTIKIVPVLIYSCLSIIMQPYPSMLTEPKLSGVQME